MNRRGAMPVNVSRTVHCKCVIVPSTKRLCTVQHSHSSSMKMVQYFSWDSLLSVYTMLLGEVSEDAFENSRVGMALFIVFMFLVVILLANVLIAIVTDSYKVIQVRSSAVWL